jgi:class 3 adenylate cyclase
MDVGGWLRGLGLGQYETIFRDNKIDAGLLPRLTDPALKDIGVSAFGDRLRLLDAIAALASAKPLADGTASLPKAAAVKAAEQSAERRPITVMFCDLVGSTGLAAKLDPEDWRNLVNAYLDEASAAVTGLGGHVLKKLGDGLMALFGYPQAQENDAERAVRAALAIQRALAEINAKNRGKGAPELSARIGIESGPVVVEATGEVFGDAPNVAARVQAAAEPGSVLVTMNVQRQVAGLFVAEEQAARELKGVSAPVQLFCIVRASGGGRRGGARTLTPFVGREEELALLARRWDSVRAGEGQLALIVGEPGLGKSRLLDEFHSQLIETPHTWSEWSASQLLQNTPLHPIAEWGRQRFGVDDASAEQRLADLKNTLGLVGLEPAEHAPLLAPLLDIPLPPGRAADFPPEELRRKQLAAMSAWVLASARSQPLVLAIEDLHWADPTSLDLLKGLAERGAQAPLLLLATTRPEFRPPWSLRSHHSIVSLRPLDRAGVAQMVGEISARHALSKEVVEGVTERTGGVPLFVEEVTRLLLERGEQGGVQAIPPTLQQSLAARLDRLGSAREVAQIGAVLGRDFAYTLLRDIANLDEPALQASLDRLADADLLFIEGAPPQASYRFKHALIQDAAYDSLLKSRRQALHRLAAEVLRDDPERAAAEPEVIAHHFTQAGLDDLAIEWWGRAGDQALRRSAFQEAIAHLGKAIAMSDKASGGMSQQGAKDAAAPSSRLKLLTDYSQAMMWSKGAAAEETKAASARAAELAGGTNDFSARFAARGSRMRAACTAGELRSARELALAFLPEAEEAGEAGKFAVAMVKTNLAVIAYWQGDFVEARDCCDAALAGEGASPDSTDWGFLGVSFLALSMWQLGEIDRARELSNRATKRAAEIALIPQLLDALFYKSYFELWRGDPLATLNAAEALEALARERGASQYLHEAELHRGWARGRIEDPAAGAADVRRVLAAFVEQRVRVNLGFYTGLLAELEAETLGAESALARIDEAFGLSNQVEHRCSLSFLHRLRGNILFRHEPANPAPAEEAFQAAIAIATEQSARSQRLQAALALAKLYQSTRRLVEAHDILAPALQGFTPTPEMPEIADAQTLLAALAETEEVKAAEEQRQRRLHLQTAYGQAMMWAKGFSAEETKEAFARAEALTAKSDDFSERWFTRHGQFRTACTEGDLRSARDLALTLLREAEAAGRVWEASVANNMLALVGCWRGDFAEARTHGERALDAGNANPGQNHLEHGDYRTYTSSFLAVTVWQLGKVERARELINWAIKRANEVGHIGALVDALFWKSCLEIWRGDPNATLSATEALELVARKHGLAQFLNEAELHSAWARGRMNDPKAGAAQVQRVLPAFVEQGVKVNLGFYSGLLAQLEAETLGAESALARIDEAFRLSNAVEHGCSLPFLHRLRGEILLKRDPSDPASAEEAFRTSIAIAKEQGARSPVRLPWQSCCNQQGTPPKLTPSWRPRSKASRPPPKCRRSPRRRRCLRRCRTPKRSRPQKPSASGGCICERPTAKR